MELQRGVCSLCSENCKVLPSSEAEEFCELLPDILYENFLSDTELQKIKISLKICPNCCYKVQVAAKIKNSFGRHVEKSDEACRFCETDENLMSIGNNWKYFTDRTEGFLTFIDFPVCVCPQCFFYFDTIFNIKSKLVFKFPQLATYKKNPSSTQQKSNDTPKRKSISKSPPSSKKRKIFDNCFAYLQPLCNNNYQIDDDLKCDKRLYKKIAYVNLINSKDVSVKETPKSRPIIKIKLKPRDKKENNKKLPFIKLTKSEEVPYKNSHKTKARRHSLVNKRDSSSESEVEKLDETPKAANSVNLVPKRRVSVFLPDGEKEEPKSVDTEEINDIVSKYIKSPSEEDEKSSISEEKTDENGIENCEEIVNEEEKNENLELTNGEKSENSISSGVDEPIEELKETNSDTPDLVGVEESSPSKSDTGSDGADSDTSDKHVQENPETDSLNGSERKKKRVTFSDEII